LSISEANQAVFDRDSASFTDLALKPAERELMERLRDRLHEYEMLDLGVGTGRTGYTFGSLVRRYVGLDYSPQMLDRARALLGDRERVELLLGDARDLSAVGGPFDLVLFSYNGIDAVGHEDRQRILAEVRRVLKPDGSFLFSAHSIGALPLTGRQAREASRSLPRQLYNFAKDLRFGWRVRRSNRALDLDAARRRGWTRVRDGAHRFDLEIYYVDPAEQLSQLRRAGFEVSVVFDPAGREMDPLQPRRDPWLDYLCRPSPAAG
jgi:SAM-dependent methyltransferase